MFIRNKKTPNQNTVVQIVENIREGTKTTQRVLRHVGTARNVNELEQLRVLAQSMKTQMEHQALAKDSGVSSYVYGSTLGRWKEVPNGKKVEISHLEETAKTILGIHDVYGSIYDHLGFGNLFTRPQQRSYAANILKEIVLARIARPTSKRAAVEFLSAEFGKEINLDHVYQAMDKMDDKFYERIQQRALAAALQLTGEKLRVLFYDATTLYFESFTEDTLKQNGYSKDMKFNQAQVILALFVTEKGLPVGYELFPGACFEGHTLIPVLEKLKTRYQIDDIVFVADRGMLGEANLKYLEDNHFNYIVGARIKNVDKKLKEKILDVQNYQKVGNNNEQKIAQFDYANQRHLIVSYSSDRARKDQHDRTKAIEKLKKKMAKSKNPKSLLSNYGYKKYIEMTGSAQIKINSAKVESDAKWDGLLGVITNLKDINAEQVLAHYRSLWQIEECFRIQKHDLKIRPIYHWTPERIKAHVAITFMAFVCIRYLEHRMAIQSQKVSPEVIRNALLQVHATTVRDKRSNNIFILPSKINSTAKEIYRVLGIKIPSKPILI